MTENQFPMDGILFMHNAIRRHTSNYEQQAITVRPEKVNQLFKRFDLYWQIVEIHHLFEDHYFFPVINRLVPDFAKSMAGLTRGHFEIVKLAEQIKEALKHLMEVSGNEAEKGTYPRFIQLVSQFKEAMEIHLSSEERVITPILSREFPVEDQIAMHQALFGLSPEQMSLEFPWVFEVLNEEETQEVLDMMPGPLVKLYNQSWKKNYEQLIASIDNN